MRNMFLKRIRKNKNIININDTKLIKLCHLTHPLYHVKRMTMHYISQIKDVYKKTNPYDIQS